MKLRPTKLNHLFAIMVIQILVTNCDCVIGASLTNQPVIQLGQNNIPKPLNGNYWAKLAPEKSDAIFGALTGGLLVLFGGFLSNRHALKRLSLELENKAAEAEKIRKHELRRAVYFPLIESTSSAIHFLGSIATVPTEEFISQKPLKDLATRTASLNIIAPQAVMETSHKALQCLTRAFMRVVARRLEIEKTANELRSVSSSMENSLQEQKSLNQRSARHIDESTSTPAIASHINETFSRTSQDFQQLLKRHKFLVPEKARMELELTRTAAAEIKTILPEMTAAIAAIRKDLGMPLELGWLTSFFGSLMDESTAPLNELLSTLEQKVAELTDESKD